MRVWWPLLAMTALLFGCGRVDGAPVVGLWENQAVLDTQLKVVARPNYVFTDRQLTEPTVFTGLQPHGSGQIVVCCVKVSKLTAVDLNTVLKKYAVDSDFTEHLQGIKGLPYVYEAEPVDSKQWTRLMQVVMRIAANKEDGSPYSVPVIGAVFDKTETLPATFSVSSQKARLTARNTADGNATRYQFTLDGKVTTFSEPSEPHD